MASLLVRDIPEETKRLLETRAAENGRSQSAEVVSMLEKELQPEGRNWLQGLIDAAREVGGVDLELPERHAAREFSFGDAL